MLEAIRSNCAVGRALPLAMGDQREASRHLIETDAACKINPCR
jgi:hypothetical protein